MKIRDQGLDDGCKSTATPGLKPLVEQLKDDKPLDADGHTEFRALAARANYLAQDRIDIQFPAKEVCRFMSSPTETSKEAMKRMGRYLIGHKWIVYTYPFQRVEGIDICGDTGWSGCHRTRRSTSGGCVMIGQHCIRTWSSTQPSVTKEVQALMLSWHWQWLMRMTTEFAARDCVQLAGPGAADLAAESMVGNCVHGVTVELEVAVP